jgi:hypothetical protein
MLELLPGIFYNTGQPQEAYDDGFLSAHAVRVVVSDAMPTGAPRVPTLMVELRGAGDALGVLDAVDKAILIHRRLSNVVVSLSAVTDPAWGIALALMRLLRCHDVPLLRELAQLNYGLRFPPSTADRLTALLQHDIALVRRVMS